MLTSERFHVPSPNTILGEWSLEDLADAHALLDMYEDLEAKAAQKA